MRTVFLRLRFAAENVVACWSKGMVEMDFFGAAVGTQNAQLPTTILTAGQTIDFLLIKITQKDRRCRWWHQHGSSLSLGSCHVAKCIH